jgi:photosystem II stability/assembly factor-like uncharacterized protein
MMSRMPKLRILLVAALVLGVACSSGSGDKSAGTVSTTASTAPATTSSTAAPAGCPKVRAATEFTAPSNLADIQMIDGQKGFAVGKRTILVTDDGATWTLRYTGAAVFSAVDAVDATHAWAVGDRSLYRTSDGGKTWRGAGNPDDGTVLRQVHFVDEHFGWGVGRGKLYRSGDGGSTWGELTPPCGAEAVCFTGQDDGWVAVGNRVYRSTSGGDSWTPAFAVSGKGPSGEPVGDTFHVDRLQCAKGGVAWASFTGEGAATSHAPYVVYRGAADGQWIPVIKESMTGPADIQAPAGGSYPGPISVLSPHDAALVQFTPPGEPPVSLTVASEDGRRLGPVRPIPGLASPLAAAGITPDRIWVLGTKTGGPPTADAILVTADAGQTWQEQYSRPAPG